MPKNIASGDLFQAGRTDAYNPIIGMSYMRYAAIVDPADEGLQFNFPNAQATGNVFGNVRSIFVDNSLNNFALRITVAGTGHTFPVSANSTGIYSVDSQQGSTILVTTAGVSSGAVEFIFYNYPQNPVVWFENGTTIVANVVVGNGDDIAQGSTTDPAITNPATDGTLIAFTRGILTGINSIVANLVAMLLDTADIVTNTNPYLYNNIAISTTTVVKATPGVVGRVTINTAGAAGSVIVYDHASGVGPVIASFNSTVVGSFELGVSAGTGITVITTGAPNVTVTYK